MPRARGTTSLAYAWPSFFEALAVLAGLHRVVERGLHLVRRLHALQRDLLDEDAGAVAVEHLLHQLLGLRRDLLAALVEHEVHLALADDLADRGLGDELRRCSSGLRLLKT